LSDRNSSMSHKEPLFGGAEGCVDELRGTGEVDWVDGAGEGFPKNASSRPQSSAWGVTFGEERSCEAAGVEVGERKSSKPLPAEGIADDREEPPPRESSPDQAKAWAA
jgi:hypothetical protein